MNLTIRALDEVLDEQTWSAFLESSPDASLFGTPYWRQVVLGVESWMMTDYSIAAVVGDLVVGIMPIQHSAHSGVLASSGWGGSGPMIFGELSQKRTLEVLVALLAAAEELSEDLHASAFSTSIPLLNTRSLKSKWGHNPLLMAGRSADTGLAIAIDLSESEESLWSSLSEHAKRQIKKARSRGVKATAVSWQDHLQRYYQLHCETYLRTGVPPHPKQYFDGIANLSSPKGTNQLFAAFAEDAQPIAFHNSYRYGFGAGYHTGCSTNVALETGANYLAFWEAIIHAKRNNFRFYETGPIFPGMSSSDKRHGLTRLKTSFGGEPHPLFTYNRPTHEKQVPPQPRMNRRERSRWGQMARWMSPSARTSKR